MAGADACTDAQRDGGRVHGQPQLDDKSPAELRARRGRKVTEQQRPHQLSGSASVEPQLGSHHDGGGGGGGGGRAGACRPQSFGNLEGCPASLASGSLGTPTGWAATAFLGALVATWNRWSLAGNCPPIPRHATCEVPKVPRCSCLHCLALPCLVLPCLAVRRVSIVLRCDTGKESRTPEGRACPRQWSPYVLRSTSYVCPPQSTREPGESWGRAEAAARSSSIRYCLGYCTTLLHQRQPRPVVAHPLSAAACMRCCSSSFIVTAHHRHPSPGTQLLCPSRAHAAEHPVLPVPIHPSIQTRPGPGVQASQATRSSVPSAKRLPHFRLSRWAVVAQVYPVMPSPPIPTSTAERSPVLQRTDQGHPSGRSWSAKRGRCRHRRLPPCFADVVVGVGAATPPLTPPRPPAPRTTTTTGYQR